MSRDELFKTGEKLPEMFSKYFIGQAYLEPIAPKGGPIMNVTFEPSCRNNWHIHHEGGQILLCTEGTGWYQEWEKEPVKLTKGMVINIGAGIKHWHGATKDSWFSHLAVEVVAENSSVEWLEPVTDEDYEKLA